MSDSGNTPKSAQRRVLLVVFDALRPDMVSPELMPTLSDFASRGVRFTRSRSVFPTETRVNQSAIVTGCRPGRHGIVGNKFIEPVASPHELFNTGDEDILRRGDANLKGELLGARALGERLHDHGRSLATLSAGTPGGGRILHHRAEQVGGFRFAMHRPDKAVPDGVYEQIKKAVGDIPAHTIPSLDWLTWAVDAWLSYVEPKHQPDVGVLWLCEPDNSFHYTGIGSEHSLDAIRHADAQFARLLEGLDPEIDVITASDHGQISVTGDAVDIEQELKGAGFSVGPVPGPDADVAVALDSAGGIFVRDHDADLTGAVAAWLIKQPWCGAISVSASCDPQNLNFRHADLGIDGARAPDIGVVLRASDGTGPHGWPGTTVHDAAYPDGGGIHGGLHPIELHNWLACAGPSFKEGAVSKTPCGVIDVLPTMLRLLGLAEPDDIDGRVLEEAMKNGPAVTPDVTTESIVCTAGGRLEVSHVNGTRYLEGLWPH